MKFTAFDYTFTLVNPAENITLLVLLIVLTLLAYFYMVYTRTKRASVFGNLKTLERVEGAKRYNVSPIVLVTKILVVSLLFFVATDTIEIKEKQAISDTDYIILLDASPSMAKTDYSPNRLTAAKEIAKRWLEDVPTGTRVGYVGFSQNIDAVIEPTQDYDRVILEIDSTEIDYSTSGTSLPYALSFGIDLLNTSIKDKAVLLLTDGTSEIGKETTAYVKNEEVKVYAFGIGSTEDIDEANIPEELREYYEPIEFNFSKLQELARESGGKAYDVEDSQELELALTKATNLTSDIRLNTGYYIVILIALLSIVELLIYSKFGGL